MIKTTDIPRGKALTGRGARRAEVVRQRDGMWDVEFFTGDTPCVPPSRSELSDTLPFETALLLGKQWVRDEPGIRPEWPLDALRAPWSVG